MREAHAQLSRSFVGRQMASMVLSHIHVENPMAAVRAAAWFNSVSRLGIHLPLFIIHDIGCLLTSQAGPGGYTIGRHEAAVVGASPPVQVVPAIDAYEKLLRKLAASGVVEKLSGFRLRDDLVAVLLTRVLSDTFQRWRDPTKRAAGGELPLDINTYKQAEPARLFGEYDPQPLWSFLQHLATQTLHIFTSTELIDLDTVRLLGLFKEDSGSGAEAIGSSLDLVDLFTALDSPEANDVANFSLDLLPSVLETKRSAGAQTFSVDGYASIERRGNVDSLVLSELAHDQEMFEQKAINQELLYFGREREREDERRLQYILVDSSASMRGKRQVFARGLALTLVKKLSLQGDEVWLRFFDSRLHETMKVARGSNFPVPFVLSFRSEHGRNYGKVFRQLLLEMARLKREQHRQVVVYIITHGQCHVAPELISALAQQAFLYGIIILPSSEVSLEFLPLLHRQQIVTGASFESMKERRERALDIVDDVSGSSEGH